METIRELAKSKLSQSINFFKNNHSDLFFNIISPALDDLLISHIKSLPKIAANCNETILRNHLQSCKGIFSLDTVCVNILPKIFTSDLIYAFTHSIKLSNKRKIVETLQPLSTKNSFSVYLYPQNQFEYFQEELTVSILNQILQQLDYSLKQKMIEKILKQMILVEGSNDLINELAEGLYILNQLILGIIHHNKEATHIVGKLCLQAVLPLISDSFEKQIIAKNELIEALSLETLGSCFIALEGTPAAKRSLVHVLFPVVRHVAAPQGSNKQIAAFATLQTIAKYTGYISINQLIQENMDYILDYSIQRLSYFERHPNMPIILTVMLKLLLSEHFEINTQLLPFLSEIIDIVFDILNDFISWENQFILGLLQVLKHVLYLIRKLQCKNFVEDKKKLSNISDNIDPIQQLVEQLSAFSNNELQEEQEPLKDDYPEENLGEIENNSKGGQFPVKPKEDTEPFHVKHSKNIMMRCRCFPLHSSIYVRRVGLEILETGFLCLENDKEDLLPMIHHCWKAIIFSLKKECTEQILICCFSLIQICLKTAKSFMRRKYYDDVWPILSRKLIENTNTSHKLSNSVHIELSVLMLNCTKSAIEITGVNRLQAQSIASSTVHFLNGNFVEQIQNSAIGVWKALFEKGSDYIWLSVISAIAEKNEIDHRYKHLDLPPSIQRFLL